MEQSMQSKKHSNPALPTLSQKSRRRRSMSRDSGLTSRTICYWILRKNNLRILCEELFLTIFSGEDQNRNCSFCSLLFVLCASHHHTNCSITSLALLLFIIHSFCSISFVSFPILTHTSCSYTAVDYLLVYCFPPDFVGRGSRLLVGSTILNTVCSVLLLPFCWGCQHHQHHHHHSYEKWQKK